MKMVQLAFLGFTAILLGLNVPPAKAQNAERNGIAVSEAWAQATPPAAKTGALYATIHNSGDKPDRLISLESDVADAGVVHKMTMEGGIMRMRPLSKGLVVPPGDTVALAPGGMHGMLIGLKQPLKAGETFHATAVFETAGRIEISVPVVAMGAPAPAGHAMEGGMNGMNMKPGERKP